MFAGDAVDGYLKRVAAELRQGQLDAKLVYRKGLRKRPAEYTANTPPHVAAARKSASSRRVVAYVMTKGGPEPVDALRANSAPLATRTGSGHSLARSRGGRC